MFTMPSTQCTPNKIPVIFRTYWNQRLWKILWMNRNFIQSKWFYFSTIYTSLSLRINYINILIVLSAITVPKSILKIWLQYHLANLLTQLPVNLGLCAPWSNNKIQYYLPQYLPLNSFYTVRQSHSEIKYTGASSYKHDKPGPRDRDNVRN